MDIYVVDDEPTIRDVLRLAWEDVGYHVIDVADGATAPDILRRCPTPCVVLVDLKMRHNGITLLEAVADDPTLLGRHAYIVVSADMRGIEAASPLLQRVGATVLPKPFNLDDLQARVADAVSQLGAA